MTRSRRRDKVQLNYTYVITGSWLRLNRSATGSIPARGLILVFFCNYFWLGLEVYINLRWKIPSTKKTSNISAIAERDAQKPDLNIFKVVKVFNCLR